MSRFVRNSWPLLLLVGCTTPQAAPATDGGAPSDALAPDDLWRPTKPEVAADVGEDMGPRPSGCFGAAPPFMAASAALAGEFASSAAVPGPSVPALPPPWGDPKGLGPDTLAVRLSRFLWREEPDAALVAAIAGCPNITREDLAVLALQMLADPRAVRSVDAFVNWWLKLERLQQVQLDMTLFPLLTPALRNSLAQEPQLFAAEIILRGDGLFRSLLTAPFTFMDGNLASLYGHPGIAASAPFQRVNLSLEVPRGGLLMQPGVLLNGALPHRHSPAERAVDVLSRFSCLDFPPPPAAGHYDPAALEPVPGRTLRSAIEATLGSPTCSACHSVLEVGFVFEPYDAIGRLRDRENGAALKTAVELRAFDGSRIADARALSLNFATSPTVTSCFASKWMWFAIGREPTTQEEELSARAAVASFAASDFNIRSLIAAVVQTRAFLAP